MGLLSKIFGSNQAAANQAGAITTVQGNVSAASNNTVTITSGTASSYIAPGSVYYNTSSGQFNTVGTNYYSCASCGNMNQYGSACQCGVIGAASGGLYIGGAGGGGSAGYVGGLTWGQPMVTLTPEEMKELQDLEERHKESTRLLKMNEFKKIPAALRQQVVDVIVWQEESSRIGTLEETKSQRQLDLETKRNSPGIMISGANWFTNAPGFAYIPTINGLTANDLKQAHLEACAEEALTGDDTESK